MKDYEEGDTYRTRCGRGRELDAPRKALAEDPGLDRGGLAW